MVSKFEDHFLVQRLRWARDHDGKLDAAFFVQTEQDVVQLIEECEALLEEVGRLQDALRQNQESIDVAARFARLEKRLEEAGL